MRFFDSDEGTVSRQNVVDVFRHLGIMAGDTLMVHSSLFTIGRLPAGEELENILNGFVDVILEILGDEGTLIVPTFTFSFCKTGLFDLRESKSEMGALSEIVRKRPPARRTHNPVHSVAIIGNKRDFFLQANPNTSFGQGSIFDLIHQDGSVKFLTVGIPNPANAITYVHYVEEACKVPYRSIKTFCGTVRTENEMSEQQIDFFIRSHPEEVIFNQQRCYGLVRDAAICVEQKLGNSIACVIAERDYYRVLRKAIAEDPRILCA
jgi:aminoglycoside 3-N-acetyltransferase